MSFIKTAAFLWSLSTAASFGIQRQSPGVTRHQPAPPYTSPAFTSNKKHGSIPFVVQRGGQRTSIDTSLSASVTTNAVTEANLSVLSERGRSAIQKLMQYDQEEKAQAHVYGGWPEAGTEDDGKSQLAEQVSSR